MDIKKYLQNLDWWLVGAVCLLSFVRLNLHCERNAYQSGESPANVIKQGVFFLIGIALMVIAANADYEYISQFTIPLYIVNILLLVTVLLVGSESKGATRWIALWASDHSALGIRQGDYDILLSEGHNRAAEADQRLENHRVSLYLYRIPLLLIQKQPALSASLVLVAIFCIEIFIAGLDWRIIRNVLVVTVPIVALILFDVSREHPLFTDKNSCGASVQPYPFLCGPQPRSQPVLSDGKSISAIGSGKFLGKGLFHGTLNQLSLSAGAT